MNPDCPTIPPEVVRASYAACHRRASRSGSSFYAGFLLLDGPRRRAMEALYAFARHSDDLADSDRPLEVRRAELARWRAAVEGALGDDGPDTRPGSHNPTSPARPTPPASFGGGACPACWHWQSSMDAGTFSANGDGTDPVAGLELLPALADAVTRFAIPRKHLMAVLDGVTMDLDGTEFATFDDLAAYCRRVASAVGLASLHIWGFRDPSAQQPADHCGLAFQLTNILRDLREDAAAGRVYLPRDELQQCDYTPEDIAAGRADARFERLMRRQIERAEAHYAHAAPLYEMIDPAGRRIYGLMWSRYRALLERIAQRPAAVLEGRVRLPRSAKVALILRWSTFPPRRLSARENQTNQRL